MTHPGSEPERIVYTGPPGSGKTRRILELFCERRRAGREDHALLIVPDAPAREHMRDVLARNAPSDLPASYSDKGIQTIHSLPGMFGVRANASQLDCRILIDKNIENGKIASAGIRILHTPGGRTALARSIGTLRENGFDAGKLSAQAGNLPFESKILIDTMNLWEEWLLHEGKTDALILLKNAKVEAEKRKWDLVLIDGFTEILPPQYDLLKAIIEHAEHAAVALDPKQPPSDKLLAQLKLYGFFERTLTLDETCRWGKPCLFRWLADIDSWRIEEELPKFPDPSATCDELTFLEASDPRIEASAIAREVALEVGKGRSYADLAILAPHLGAFRETLESEFRRAGIPLRCYVDRSILETGPGAFMDAVLAVASGDWSDTCITELLSHPGAGIPSDEARDASLHTSVDERLGSKERWLGWVGKQKDWKSYELLHEIDVLTNSDVTDPVKFTGKLTDLVGSKLRESWCDLDDSLVEDEGWAWECVRENVLDTGRALSQAEEEYSVSDITVFIREELKGVQARPLDRRRNCVSALTLMGARTWSIPVAIVAGLTRSYFPRRSVPDAFLPDKLREALVPSLPGSREMRDRKQAEFRIAVTRATGRLILSMPLADRDGSPLLPSVPLTKCREWLGERAKGCTVQYLNDPPMSPDRAVYKSDIGSQLYQLKINDKELFGKLESSGEMKSGIAVARSHYEKPVLNDASMLVNAAKGSHQSPISATHLNNLAQCKYRFFASRLLKLRESDRTRIANGLDYAQWGSIAHEALALWHKSGRKAKFEDVIQQACERLLRGIPDSSVIEGRKRQLVDALDRFRQFEDKYIIPLGFRPEYVELDFHARPPESRKDWPNRHEPVEFTVSPDNTLVLGGRIDRVDIGAEDTALIIDYKRSESSVAGNIKRLVEDRDFQLAIYIALAEKGLGLNVQLAFFMPLIESTPESVNKVLADDSISGYLEAFDIKRLKVPVNPEEHLLNAMARISGLIEELKSSDITPKPADEALCGTACAYHDLCRFRFTGDEPGSGGDAE
jgi:hypothetical protein